MTSEQNDNSLTNRRVMAAFIFLALASILAVGGALLSFTQPPTVQYIGVSQNMQVAKIPSFADPYMSNSAIRNWAARVVVATFSLNFERYQNELSRVESDYTASAFSSVDGQLTSKKKGILPTIIANRMTASAVVTDNPRLVAYGPMRGIYRWNISFPIRLVLKGSSGSNMNTEYLVQVLIRRVNTFYNPKGVAIEQILISPYNGG